MDNPPKKIPIKNLSHFGLSCVSPFIFAEPHDALSPFHPSPGSGSDLYRPIRRNKREGKKPAYSSQLTVEAKASRQGPIFPLFLNVAFLLFSSS